MFAPSVGLKSYQSKIWGNMLGAFQKRHISSVYKFVIPSWTEAGKGNYVLNSSKPPCNFLKTTWDNVDKVVQWTHRWWIYHVQREGENGKTLGICSDKPADARTGAHKFEVSRGPGVGLED